MALLDIIIPSRNIVINQAVLDKPQVTIDVFGLNTEDFVYLVDGYKTILASIFLRNAKEDLKNVETSKEIIGSFQEFSAACVACGCRQRDAQEYTAQNLGLRVHKGDSDGVSCDTPSVSTAALAAKIAQREMRPLSVPLVTCVVECNRSMFDAEMCDVVLLSWPPIKVENMVMRIMGVDLGSLEDRTIKLSLSTSKQMYRLKRAGK